MDQPASNESRVYLFKVGENALCFYGALLYEVRILETTEEEDEAKRLFNVHYLRWPKRWDEWVPRSRLLEITVRNRQRATELRLENGAKADNESELKRQLRKRKTGADKRKSRTADLETSSSARENTAASNSGAGTSKLTQGTSKEDDDATDPPEPVKDSDGDEVCVLKNIPASVDPRSVTSADVRNNALEGIVASCNLTSDIVSGGTGGAPRGNISVPAVDIYTCCFVPGPRFRITFMQQMYVCRNPLEKEPPPWIPYVGGLLLKAISHSPGHLARLNIRNCSGRICGMDKCPGLPQQQTNGVTNGMFPVLAKMYPGMEEIIVKDRERIDSGKELVKLPVLAEKSVSGLLKKYLETEGSSHRYAKAVCDALHQAFHCTLKQMLTFEPEKVQHEQMLRLLQTDAWKDKCVCDVYGFVHLARTYSMLHKCLSWNANFGTRHEIEMDFFLFASFLMKDHWESKPRKLYQPGPSKPAI